MPPVWSRCTACELLLLFAIPAIHFIWLGISSQGQPGFQHPWKEVREIVQPHSQQSQLNKSLAQAANTANTLMFGIPSQLVWRVPPVKRVPTPHIPLVLWPESGMPNFCCYDGIRCQVFEYIQEYTEYTIFVSSHIPLLYSPMVGTIVDGLRGRAKTCGYKVVEVYERQSKEVDGDGLYKVSHEVKESRKPTEPTAGDVWIHVGKGLQWEFYRDCQNSFAAQRVYCILYQSDPVDVEAGPGICEIWEYSAADIPKAPVVRYVPPGYRPLWQGRNDQELSTFNTSRMEWVFLGYLGKVQRLECWNHLRSMPELQHVIFTNYSNVWRKSDWQELARRPNVLFLNMHGNCNSTRIRDGLETVRISTILSFGGLMVSQTANDFEMNLFQNIVIFEQNLFKSYSNWSPKFRELLGNSTKMTAFRRRAYSLYKRKFHPGRILETAQVWKGQLGGPNCST